MSLLEDIFLQDEAGEAQELERVIEGDEFEDRRRSDSEDDSEKEDEAVEDKRRVDPTQAKPKRVVKNPRVILNPARLTGPRGIQLIPEHFKDFKFKGKGHEKEDLDLVLKKLEHWAYRLFPKFQFDDCLKKIETLGKKRPVMVHLQKIRSDQYQSEEVVVQKDSSDEDAAPANEVEDEFDKLLGEQIELARAKMDTPGSVMKGFQTPSAVDKRTSFVMPKATSSPSISEEQKQRMIMNRKLAEERRLARLKQDQSANKEVTSSDVLNHNATEVNAPEESEIEEPFAKKHNKSNVIDSDDDETQNDRDRGTISNVSLIENENEEINIRKPNRSYVIDSSDEEATENIVVTVDLHDGQDKSVHKINENDVQVTEHVDLTNVESNIVTDNEESNKFFENDMVIDITNQEIIKTGPKHIIATVDLSNVEEQAETNEIMRKRRNKPVVMDSSDEECDITSVNKEVTVETYNNVLHIEKSNTKQKSSKNIHENIDIEIINQESENDILTVDENLAHNEENNSNNDNIEMRQDFNTEDLEKVTYKKNTEPFNDILRENENEILPEDNISNNSSENLIISEETPVTSNNSNNLKPSDDVQEIEELMDVDFSEDF